MQETEKSRGCVKPRVCTRNMKVSKWGQLLKYADTNQSSYFAEEETRHRALLPGDPHGVTCSECMVETTWPWHRKIQASLGSPDPSSL